MNTTKKLLLPPELVTEVALGIEQPLDLFRRYGFSDAECEEITKSRWFAKEIAAKRVKLEEEGFNFSAKMKMLAEDLMTEAYLQAKESDSVSAKLEVGKYLSKLADLEPRANAQSISGPGFQINITVPQVENVAPAVEIEHRPVDESKEERAGSLGDEGTFTMVTSDTKPLPTKDIRLRSSSLTDRLAGRDKLETIAGVRRTPPKDNEDGT